MKIIVVMLRRANGPLPAAKLPPILAVAPIPLVVMVRPGILALILPIIMVLLFMQRPLAMCSSPAGMVAMVAISVLVMILGFKQPMPI